MWKETDINTCVQCKHWGWFEEYQEYRCGIKGCWDGSKFKEFNWEDMLKEMGNKHG